MADEGTAGEKATVDGMPDQGTSAGGRVRTILKWSGIGLVALFVVIQAIPYGRDHTNPAVVAEPAWDSPRTRELAVAACFDCHSNETKWPWYTNVAPVSWLAQNDVEQGRATLNLSVWAGATHGSGEAAEVVQEGEMPPPYYRWLHSASRLTDAEKAELIVGLQASLGG